MTRDQMQKLMDDNPNLCGMGWGLVRGTRRDYDERLATFNEWRTRLAGNTVGPTFAAWWLSDYPKTKTVRPHTSSYYLKHILEGMTGVYLTNGEFIAGAIFAGFRLRTHDDCINVGLNIDTRKMPDLNDLGLKHRHHWAERIASLLARYGHEDPETADYYRQTYLKELVPCST